MQLRTLLSYLGKEVQFLLLSSHGAEIDLRVPRQEHALQCREDVGMSVLADTPVQGATVPSSVTWELHLDLLPSEVSMG